MAEYEALLIGLKKAKDMNISEISVFGHTELIIQQLRNVYKTKHLRLRDYRNAVRDIVKDSFLALNISFVPRESNILADSLFISASSFKIPMSIKLKYEVEVRFRPNIPDNVNHWKVFEDDQEIRKFIEVAEEFVVLNIDKEEDLTQADVDHQDSRNLKKQITDQPIIQLPTNHIPKGLIPLEKLFYQNDVAVKP